MPIANDLNNNKIADVKSGMNWRGYTITLSEALIKEMLVKIKDKKFGKRFREFHVQEKALVIAEPRTSDTLLLFTHNNKKMAKDLDDTFDLKPADILKALNAFSSVKATSIDWTFSKGMTKLESQVGNGMWTIWLPTGQDLYDRDYMTFRA